MARSNVSLLSSLTILLLAITQVASAASMLEGYEKHTTWFWQRALVAKGWLYIDGGEIHGSSSADGDVKAAWNEHTYAINLASSWTTSNVVAKANYKPENVVVSRRPELWFDGTRVLQSGGIAYKRGGGHIHMDRPAEVWGFTPQSDGTVDWELQESSIKGRTGNAMLATSPEKQYSFFGFGNYFDSSKKDRYYAREELITYSKSADTFTNTTLPGQRRLYGEAQYVGGFGKKGVVLLFGGIIPDAKYVASGTPNAGLDQIQVYDIETGKFYTQTASNAPSGGRTNFCSVGASQAGDGTFEIFIFGGRSEADDEKSVWILTLPAFAWVKAPNDALNWREKHSCVKLNEREMISVGGVQGEDWKRQDTWSNGLGIYDLTSLKWTHSHAATISPYKQPGIVGDVYANGVTVKWSDTALKTIFGVKKAATTTTTPSSGSGSGSGSGSSSGGSPSGGSSSGGSSGGGLSSSNPSSAVDDEEDEEDSTTTSPSGSTTSPKPSSTSLIIVDDTEEEDEDSDTTTFTKPKSSDAEVIATSGNTNLDTSGSTQSSSGGPDFTNADTPESQKQETPVGAIVGGSIGGCGLLVVIVFGACFFVRRNGQNGSQKLEEGAMSPTTAGPMYAGATAGGTTTPRSELNGSPGGAGAVVVPAGNRGELWTENNYHHADSRQLHEADSVVAPQGKNVFELSSDGAVKYA